MADKIYIGKDVEAYQSAPTVQYSRVTIDVGTDENGNVLSYTAGDDTQSELVIKCPWGTQAMANNILASLSSYSYKPYAANSSHVHPAAELGDAVTVGDDIYSGIYGRQIEFSTEPITSVQAPGEEEIDDEYEYRNPVERELTRKIINDTNAVKASLTIDIGEIRLEVAGKINANDAQSLITQTLNNITLSVTDGSQSNTSKITISGTGISAVSDNITLKANSINFNTATIAGLLTAANIDVAGIITAGGLSIKQDTLSGVEVQYALSTSNTTAPSTGWNTTAPMWEDGKYMWQKTVWTYANGSTSESDPTCLTGATGATGTSITILGSYNTYAELIAAHPTGNTGDGYLVGGDLYVWNGSAWQDVGQIKGDTGATGKGITSLTPQYYLSTSSVSATGGSWQNTVPTYVSGRYYWERSHITWSDGTTSDTTAVYNSALTSSVRDAGNAASGVTAIENNIYTAGTTTIDGAKITTGSIVANKIDATNLHVSAANIDGTLVIGQLPSTVAETSDIPTKVSDLTNDSGYQNSTQVNTAITSKGYQTSAQVENAIVSKGYQTSAQVESAITSKGYQNASGVTSIINGTVTTDFVEALNIDVEAAQIKDTLTIGQLPNTVAQKSDVPVIIGQTTIQGGMIATNTITANQLAADAIKSQNYESGWTYVYDAFDNQDHDATKYTFSIGGTIYEFEEAIPFGPTDNYDTGLVINTDKTYVRTYTISTGWLNTYNIPLTVVSSYDEYAEFLPLSDKYGLPFAGTMLNLSTGELTSQSFKISNTEAQFVGNVKSSRFENCKALVTDYAIHVYGSASLDSFDKEVYARQKYAKQNYTFWYSYIEMWDEEQQEWTWDYSWADADDKPVDLAQLGIVLVDAPDEGDRIVIAYSETWSPIITYQDLIDLGLIH